MELNKHQLVQLKSIELEILEKFVKICEELNLKYYLVEGTLLGAVRHKGFIPWDDDIDVGMPRADYEKFLQVGQKYLPEHYFLQCFKTDPEYANNFAKIRNSNTTFIESSCAKLKINHGVYIDIFPLDFYPTKHTRWFEFKKKMLSIRISDIYIHRQKPRLITRILRPLTKVVYPTYQQAVVKKDTLLSSTHNGAKLTNFGSAWGAREIVPAEWYGDGKKLLFEGIEVNVPTEYDMLLRQIYGDYMQLPPIEKRKGHHYVDVIDFEKSYTYYLRNKDGK